MTVFFFALASPEIPTKAIATDQTTKKPCYFMKTVPKNYNWQVKGSSIFKDILHKLWKTGFLIFYS